jgi:hypothetical protein
MLLENKWKKVPSPLGERVRVRVRGRKDEKGGCGNSVGVGFRPFYYERVGKNSGEI